MLHFAQRCMKAGHHVRVCMARDKETKQRCRNGDGLIEKVENEEWAKHMNWADLVIASDNVKWLKELDCYRKKGYPVFAPSYESAQLELERGKGQDLFRKVGIQVADYEVFRDYRAAEKHVRAQMKRFVSKPMGDRDKALSYVSESPADMCYMLQRWAKLEPVCKPFLLQEFVGGIEFGVAGWLGRKGFARYVEENFEHKKFMNDDVGPNTGEQGTACKYVSQSSLADEVLFPLESELIRMGHTGSVDVSVIVRVDEDGSPMPLEFSCRLGWPSFDICQSLHPDPCGWMVPLLDGEDIFEPSLDHAIGVVMSIKPYPNKCPEPKVLMGIPVYGLDDENQYRDHLSPCNLESGTAPTMADGEVQDKRCFVST